MRSKFVSLIITLTVLSGCSAILTNKLDFDPTEPIRIAVLPFYQVDDDGKVINPDTSILLIDNVPGVSKQLEDPPALIIQKLIQSELAKTRFDILSPWSTQTNLIHNGFTKGVTFDFSRIESSSPRALCELLSCDAVLFGKVTEWDRSYYGVQTVSTVRFDLRLVRASDGRELFSAQSEDSDSRGITKGPTGYTSLVIEPIRGLDNDVIVNLARDLVGKTLSPLRVENRPEFLDTAPPGIFASAHDLPGGAMSRGEPLTVVMIASGGATATFSIGDLIENVPMSEIERGHYRGEFFPLETDHFERESVVVAVTDRFGRITEQRIGLSPVTLK